MADRKRCAIYTRKSTEEGLEQDFNSLDAQREACAAYILSQAAEGWEQVDEHYDDGGWSGGSMVRPALKQLLADIEANKVDIIVVYKVDRLTRSLADFAKIVEIFDEREASFVSVTHTPCRSTGQNSAHFSASSEPILNQLQTATGGRFLGLRDMRPNWPIVPVSKWSQSRL